MTPENESFWKGFREKGRVKRRWRWSNPVYTEGVSNDIKGLIKGGLLQTAETGVESIRGVVLWGRERTSIMNQGGRQRGNRKMGNSDNSRLDRT